ncbi:MAG: serine hydrolase domain-containing protein [Candidatus Acidiferrales bacterium]
MKVVVVVGLLALSWSCAALAAQPAAPCADVAGLWGMEQLYGPLVRGELTLDGRAAKWRARIAGYDVPVQREASTMAFRLPGHAGAFRGYLSADGRAIIGHWIQPAGILSPTSYATPVELNPARPGVWRGPVLPLDERISLYLWIEVGPEGSLTAHVYNPEFNFRGNRSYRVVRERDSLTFSAQNNAGDQFGADCDASGRTLTLRFPELPLRFVLVRRQEQDAIGFLPRARLGSPYRYQPPIAEQDGWQVGSLHDVGLDPEQVAALIERIGSADPRTNPWPIHSLLIARRGKLVLEEYFYGYGPQRTHDMRSASKTFAPMLLGAAAEHGAKITPATPIYPLFDGYEELANSDARKSKLTIEHLMTMTSGLACDDNDDSSPGHEDRMQQQEQPDWHKYTLDLPLARDPGGKQAVYCSAGINLLGGVIAQVTGKWLPRLFQEYVAGPLQFGNYHMNLMPTGDAYLGGGLYLRPRDQLKLGQLYLSGGLWNGRRVISQQWVARSTDEHSAFKPSFGVDHGYGYGWHLHHVKVGDKVFRQYAAEGNGGQLVLLFPELDLVVAVSGGSYGNFRVWGKWGVDLLPKSILPAIVDQRP